MHTHEFFGRPVDDSRTSNLDVLGDMASPELRVFNVGVAADEGTDNVAGSDGFVWADNALGEGKLCLFFD